VLAVGTEPANRQQAYEQSGSGCSVSAHLPDLVVSTSSTARTIRASALLASA